MTRKNAAAAPRAKIAVVIDEFVQAAGLTDFIISVVDGLLTAAAGREVILVMRVPPSRWSPRGAARFGRRAARALVRRQWLLPPLDEHPDRILERLRQDGLPAQMVHLIPKTKRALIRFCKTYAIDAVIPVMGAMPRNFPVPWVGYIYDFQHRYYPHFFDRWELRGRDAAFRTMVSRATAVVVNAEQVSSDVRKFLGNAGARIFALPFSAAPKLKWFESSIPEVRAKYAIPPRYFLISNQFWIHKRHEVALAAFIKIARRHADIHLICTGATHDPRAPDHLAMLLSMVRQSGVADRIQFLGLIPKDDQIALMRGCAAVVQPTAFEGGPGGGSVFDAVALGVRSLVSDIPVNREINAHVTHYFPLDDVSALAERMEMILATERMEEAPAILLRLGRERRLRTGETLWAAVDHAISMPKHAVRTDRAI